MEKFYFEVPGIKRKEEAIEYIEEFKKYNSEIFGVGGLMRFTNNYEDWLEKLEKDYVAQPTELKVPARTYFLVNADTGKIVGMCNIRTKLNERLIKTAGHIGYSIRPEERKKGYNKINLYLALKVCKKYGIKEALLEANLSNTASWKTMEALGAVKTDEYYDNSGKRVVVKYKIDVLSTFNKYGALYEEFIDENLNEI